MEVCLVVALAGIRCPLAAPYSPGMSPAGARPVSSPDTADASSGMSIDTSQDSYTAAALLHILRSVGPCSTAVRKVWFNSCRDMRAPLPARGLGGGGEIVERTADCAHCTSRDAVSTATSLSADRPFKCSRSTLMTDCSATNCKGRSGAGPIRGAGSVSSQELLRPRTRCRRAAEEPASLSHAIRFADAASSPNPDWLSKPIHASESNRTGPVLTAAMTIVLISSSSRNGRA